MHLQEGDIPVIDLFAGPGGLGEGFSQCRSRGGGRYRIVLSVEMDELAHRTLELRSFHRQFAGRRTPARYYSHLRGEIGRDELMEHHPEEAAAASFEACRAELGTRSGNAEVCRRLDEIEAEVGLEHAVVIGGPPCQAYSQIGRARRSRAERSGAYRESEDGRHELYKQYLAILKRYRPAMFVMENVRGILSSTYRKERIFPRILQDLRDAGYELTGLGAPGDLLGSQQDDRDFLLQADRHGVPQQRSRVFVVGMRSDLAGPEFYDLVLPTSESTMTVRHAIADLPPIRSGLSKEQDGPEEWMSAIRAASGAVLKQVRSKSPKAADRMKKAIERMTARSRGGEFVAVAKCPKPTEAARSLQKWLRDDRIGGVLNHASRGHIRSDLARYLFMASWAGEHGSSPVLSEYPVSLLPDHANVVEARKSRSLAKVSFADRFRVQGAGGPATTITSHISKDGHYYVHYDPEQCRSLTVREAARIQTFPDNYFFCGPRTSQYHQVGNAVPPLLAREIGRLLLGLPQMRGA